MHLLAGGVADASERLMESKLLEWLWFGAASWRGVRDGLFLKCGDLDCYVFAEDGGESGRWKGRVTLASGPTLKRLGGLLRPMFLIRLDPVLQGWWLSRLVNAFWLEVSSVPKSGPTDGRRRTCVLVSCGDGSLQQYNRSYPPCVVLLVCVPTVYCYVYEYK
jgi:hypothetical protein